MELCVLSAAAGYQPFPLDRGGFVLLLVPIFQPGYPEDKALILSAFSSSFVTVSP